MLRLSTLGGLVLHQDGQLRTGPAARRRRLALLAVIASAGRCGVGRDRLLALLWTGREVGALDLAGGIVLLVAGARRD